MSSSATSSGWGISKSMRDEIDEVFAEFTNTTPGCAIGIYQGGEIVYANGYGMSNLEHNVPITPSSIFHVASISKQFTAMCIALLQRDGLLDVDDPVRKYVPDLPTYEHVITIRHLLHHVSGLRDQWILLRLAGWREDDLITESDSFDLIKRQQETNFVPNDQYMYSNSGYTLLAMIVKAVSGKSLREFAHERIFQPLGMMNTHFHDDHSEIVPGRTQAYKPRDEGGYHISIPVFDVVGTTSLFTTVEDFARWNENFASAIVGDTDLIEMVQTPGVFNDDKAMEYAWGLSIDEWRGTKRVGHDGADHGYRASYFRLPEFDFSVTVFSNLSTCAPRALAEKVASIVLSSHLQEDEQPTAKVEKEEESPLNTKPTQLAGVYSGPEDNGLPLHLIIQENEGSAQVLLGDESVPLTQTRDGEYELRGGFASLWATQLHDTGAAKQLGFRFGEGEVSTYSRVEPSGFEEHSLEDFAGTYSCPELDISVVLVSDGARNVVTWNQRKFEGRTCIQVAPSVLGASSLGASMRLEYEFDDNGVATGFRLSGSRLRNLRFIRQ